MTGKSTRNGVYAESVVRFIRMRACVCIFCVCSCFAFDLGVFWDENAFSFELFCLCVGWSNCGGRQTASTCLLACLLVGTCHHLTNLRLDKLLSFALSLSLSLSPCVSVYRFFNERSHVL